MYFDGKRTVRCSRRSHTSNFVNCFHRTMRISTFVPDFHKFIFTRNQISFGRDNSCGCSEALTEFRSRFRVDFARPRPAHPEIFPHIRESSTSIPLVTHPALDDTDTLEYSDDKNVKENDHCPAHRMYSGVRVAPRRRKSVMLHKPPSPQASASPER